MGSGHKDFKIKQDFADKRLEVFCVYSSFHIAQMQVSNEQDIIIGDRILFRRTSKSTKK